MGNKQAKTIFITITAVILVGVGFAFFSQQATAPVDETTIPTAAAVTTVPETSVRYEGVSGTDALTLLKKQAPVEQESSGLVSSINGRKADDSKHEYWAFYVNGEMAQVGPADYETKDGDNIEWKIEKY